MSACNVCAWLNVMQKLTPATSHQSNQTCCRVDLSQKLPISVRVAEGFLPPAASHAQNPCCPASVLPKLSCGSKLDPHRVCGRTINSTQTARGGLGNVWLSVNWCWGPFQYHRSRNWSDGKCLTLKNTTKRLTPDSLMRVSARHTSGRVSERASGGVGGWGMFPVFG